MRFRLRTVFILLTLLALVLGWVIERVHLANQILLREEQLANLTRPGAGMGMGVGLRYVENPYDSVEEFLNAMRAAQDPEEFFETVPPFSESELAADAVPGLIECLDDTNPLVRERTIHVLTSMGPQAAAAVPAVVPLLEEEELRTYVLIFLGRCGREASAALPALRKLMMDDNSPDASFATVTVGMIAPSTEVKTRLKDLLRSKYVQNRQQAVFHLPDFFDGETTRALLEQLYEQEDNPDVKSSIVDTLNQLESPLSRAGRVGNERQRVSGEGG